MINAVEKEYSAASNWMYKFSGIWRGLDFDVLKLNQKV